MKLDVPKALEPQVRAFIEELQREHPESPAAARKLAIHALLHRGLLASENAKGLAKK
jgi:hypothetical protein